MFTKEGIDFLKHVQKKTKQAGKPFHVGEMLFGGPDIGKPEDFNFKPGDRIDYAGEAGTIIMCGQSGVRGLVEFDEECGGKKKRMVFYSAITPKNEGL